MIFIAALFFRFLEIFKIHIMWIFLWYFCWWQKVVYFAIAAKSYFLTLTFGINETEYYSGRFLIRGVFLSNEVVELFKPNLQNFVCWYCIKTWPMSFNIQWKINRFLDGFKSIKRKFWGKIGQRIKGHLYYKPNKEQNVCPLKKNSVCEQYSLSIRASNHNKIDTWWFQGVLKRDYCSTKVFINKNL